MNNNKRRNTEDILRLLKEVPNLAQLPPAELAKYFPYEAEIEEQVYDTLNCTLIPEYRLPWVEELFVPGHPYFEAYCKARDAYERLCKRLGACEEDRDVEMIFNYLGKQKQIIAMKMFEYGRVYEKMQSKQ